MLELGLKVFISYLLGSLNGALLVGRLFAGVDIRKLGSGNAGGTNALRTQGKLFAALVMIIDIAKGLFPVAVLPGLVIAGIQLDPAVSREWLTYACGGAAIFGHCYPVWFDFAGGKGAATAIGALGGIAPIVLVPALVGWIATLIITGYVGLATIMAAWAVPLYLWLSDPNEYRDLIFFTSIVAFFIVFTHRSNLAKLLAGSSRRDFSYSLVGLLNKKA